jgi:hypothetical protein
MFLNDHFFKWEYSNWFTGKLSDFIGVLILPFLLTYFASKYLKTNLLITGLFFIFWKSEFSNSFINFYNKYSLIEITRIVDYSDLIALMMLPVSYVMISRILNDKMKFKINYQINQIIILIPAIFILMATSPPKSFYYTHSYGSIECYKCGFTLPYSQSEIVDRLKNSNIHFDTIFNINPEINRIHSFEKDSIKFYKINNLIIEQDTLKNIDFSMLNKRNGKTKVYFNGFEYSGNISDEKMKKKLRKYYYKLIKNYIKEQVK